MFDVKAVHDGNERTHDAMTCGTCVFQAKVNGMAAMLHTMRETERSLAIHILRGRWCFECGSTTGRRCQCTNDE